MPLSYENKRIIDAEITKRFLRDNRDIVKKLVGNFAVCMNDGGFRYYLKGGNAVAILRDGNEEHLDGDFDFQLRPAAGDYANWTGNYANLNTRLVHILKDTVDITAAMEDIGRFREECFETEAVKALAAAKGIDLGGLRRLERRSDIMYIGRKYGEMSYTGIIESGNGGRIEEKGIVEDSEEEFDGRGKAFGPSVYVNYTIPGFILYRMVYSYSYEMDGQRFNLKSEIIDLSIPRPGSAEVYLSQEGVVTYFRDSGIAGYPFQIPGWGYHLYENINLLQEIELGVSGSADKKQKRVDRLKEALDVLEKANGRAGKLENILKMYINEPLHNAAYGEPYGRIRGYFGALAFHVSEYQGAYCRDAIEGMKGRIYDIIQSYYRNLCTWWGSRYEGWQRLVYFRTDAKIDMALHQTEAVKRCAARFIAGYTWPDRSHPGIRAAMKMGEDYQFISPMLSEDQLFFPFDYIVVQIAAKPFGAGPDLYSSFKEYCGGSGRKKDIRFADYGDAFTYILNEAADSGFKVKRAYGVIFQKYDGTELPAMDTHLKDFLTQSILESQRYPLAKLLESGR